MLLPALVFSLFLSLSDQILLFSGQFWTCSDRPEVTFECGPLLYLLHLYISGWVYRFPQILDLWRSLKCIFQASLCAKQATKQLLRNNSVVVVIGGKRICSSSPCHFRNVNQQPLGNKPISESFRLLLLLSKQFETCETWKSIQMKTADVPSTSLTSYTANIHNFDQHESVKKTTKNLDSLLPLI